MSKQYLIFAELFAKLSPYEVNHLSEILLCKIEECYEGKLLSKTNYQLNERDLKFALTNAMRDTVLEIQEREITQQKIRLAQKRTEVFSLDILAA